MTFEQMKEWKRQKGYSYQQLSQLSGVPLGTVQKIFTGETRSPRFDTLQALERVLSPDIVYTSAGQSLRVEAPMPEYDAAPLPQRDSAIVMEGENREEKTVESFAGIRETSKTGEDREEKTVKIPPAIHQVYLMELGSSFLQIVREESSEGLVLCAPVRICPNKDENTVFYPDLAVICGEMCVKEEGVYSAPDLVVEVLSPDSRKEDQFRKPIIYQESGVREYWLVDPQKGNAMVYCFETEELPAVYASDEEIPVGIFGGKRKVCLKKAYDLVRKIINE